MVSLFNVANIISNKFRLSGDSIPQIHKLKGIKTPSFYEKETKGDDTMELAKIKFCPNCNQTLNPIFHDIGVVGYVCKNCRVPIEFDLKEIDGMNIEEVVHDKIMEVVKFSILEQLKDSSLKALARQIAYLVSKESFDSYVGYQGSLFYALKLLYKYRDELRMTKAKQINLRIIEESDIL